MRFVLVAIVLGLVWAIARLYTLGAVPPSAFVVIAVSILGPTGIFWGLARPFQRRRSVRVAASPREVFEAARSVWREGTADGCSTSIDEASAPSRLVVRQQDVNMTTRWTYDVRPAGSGEAQLDLTQAVEIRRWPVGPFARVVADARMQLAEAVLRRTVETRRRDAGISPG